MKEGQIGDGSTNLYTDDNCMYFILMTVHCIYFILMTAVYTYFKHFVISYNDCSRFHYLIFFSHMRFNYPGVLITPDKLRF